MNFLFLTFLTLFFSYCAAQHSFWFNKLFHTLHFHHWDLNNQLMGWFDDHSNPLSSCWPFTVALLFLPALMCSVFYIIYISESAVSVQPKHGSQRCLYVTLIRTFRRAPVLTPEQNARLPLSQLVPELWATLTVWEGSRLSHTTLQRCCFQMKPREVHCVYSHPLRLWNCSLMQLVLLIGNFQLTQRSTLVITPPSRIL